MTLESPSRVRSYEEQREGGKKSRQMRRFLLLVQRRKAGGEKPALCPVPAGGVGAGLDASGGGATHRSRDVRARGSLAVGPGRHGASDLLLFPQQLPVLLLPVLHVDQQRDEAVLHLDLETLLWTKLTRAGDEEVRHFTKTYELMDLLLSHFQIKVPPSHSPVRLAEPRPGSAPRCNAGWPSPLPPASPSAQTQTADAALERKHHL